MSDAARHGQQSLPDDKPAVSSAAGSDDNDRDSDTGGGDDDSNNQNGSRSNHSAKNQEDRDNGIPSVSDAVAAATAAANDSSGHGLAESGKSDGSQHAVPSGSASLDEGDNAEGKTDGSIVKEIEDEAPKTFPQILMEILSNPEMEDTIAWLPHGRSFIIYKKKKFAAQVIPKYFKATKFTSFTRKLNRWGFTRVTRGPEMGSYYHKFFIRDDPTLCLRMSSHSSSKFQEQQNLVPSAMNNVPFGMPFGMGAMGMPGMNPMMGMQSMGPGDMAQQQHQVINQQLQHLQWQQFQLQQFQQHPSAPHPHHQGQQQQQQHPGHPHQAPTHPHGMGHHGAPLQTGGYHGHPSAMSGLHHVPPGMPHHGGHPGMSQGGHLPPGASTQQPSMGTNPGPGTSSG